MQTLLPQLSYTLFFVLETTFFVLAIVHIIRHPVKLQDYQVNLVMIVIFLCYFFNFLEKTVYTGTEGKYFSMIHPLGNLSPFLFTVTFIALFMPLKIKKYYFAIIATIMPGMTGACLYNSIGSIINSGPYVYSCIVFDNFAHLLISLLGFYAVRNRIIEYSRKEQTFACLFLLAVPLLALILNIIFDTSFFGLSLTGKHNIYNLVLTESGYISALIYFTCLIIIITGGNHFIRFIIKKERRK